MYPMLSYPLEFMILRAAEILKDDRMAMEFIACVNLYRRHANIPFGVTAPVS